MYRSAVPVLRSPADPLFDRAFQQLTSSFLGTARRSPTVDAAWRDGSLVLTVDLPGVAADDVTVEVSGRTLTLGAHTDELQWERSVRLGAALDPEQVTATHTDGRLTVVVGVTPAPESRRIDIGTVRPAINSNVDVREDDDRTSGDMALADAAGEPAGDES